jgi:hypothetical protein
LSRALVEGRGWMGDGETGRATLRRLVLGSLSMEMQYFLFHSLYNDFDMCQGCAVYRSVGQSVVLSSPAFLNPCKFFKRWTLESYSSAQLSYD